MRGSQKNNVQVKFKKGVKMITGIYINYTDIPNTPT